MISTLLPIKMTVAKMTWPSLLNPEKFVGKSLERKERINPRHEGINPSADEEVPRLRSCGDAVEESVHVGHLAGETKLRQVDQETSCDHPKEDKAPRVHKHVMDAVSMLYVPNIERREM